MCLYGYVLLYMRVHNGQALGLALELDPSLGLSQDLLFFSGSSPFLTLSFFHTGTTTGQSCN